MAFDITPTSGAAPYTLSAIIANSENIDSVNFVASVRTSQTVGVCPETATGAQLSEAQINDLIANGSTTVGVSTSVPEGSCRAFTLRITKVSNDSVIALSTVHVDNV